MIKTLIERGFGGKTNFIQNFSEMSLAIEIPKTERKLREAHFFLGKTLRYKTSWNSEKFHFYLSAFLNAGRSVTWVLQKEQKLKYRDFRDEWLLKLTDHDRYLLNFMKNQRNVEVKETGANYDQGKLDIPVYSEHKDEDGHVYVSAPPEPYISGPPVVLHKPIRYFELGDQVIEVTDACAGYVALLDRFVKDFFKFEYPLQREDIEE